MPERADGAAGEVTDATRSDPAAKAAGSDERAARKALVPALPAPPPTERAAYAVIWAAILGLLAYLTTRG